jgi:hypothetical protein
MSAEADRLDLMLDGFLQDDLEDGERAELAAAIASSPQTARRFAEAVADDAILRLVLGGAQADPGRPVLLEELAAASACSAPPRAVARRPRKLPGRPAARVPAAVGWLVAGLAAAALLAAALFRFGVFDARAPRVGGAPSAIAELAGEPEAGLAVVRGGAFLAARRGLGFEPGDRIETGPRSHGTIQWFGHPRSGDAAPDREETLIEVQPGSALELGLGPGGAKRVALASGRIRCRVAPQPAGRPMWVTAPHARAEVLGTCFTLASDGSVTRLEVEEGRVRLTRAADGRSVEVAAGARADSARLVAEAGPGDPAPGPWEKLFNGRDLAGWQIMKGRWWVEDGMLTGTGRDDDRLRGAVVETLRGYADFELSCQVRVEGGRYGELQIRNVGCTFPQEYPEPGAWRQVWVRVVGSRIEATLDGAPWGPSPEESTGQTRAGPVAFYVKEGGRMSVKELRLREIRSHRQ